jgi:hypothetical protein
VLFNSARLLRFEPTAASTEFFRTNQERAG